MATQVWHITGANTGIGLELAKKALSEGDSVIAAVRSPERVPDELRVPAVKVLKFDLAWSQDEMDIYVKDVVTAFGRVDIVVNNAGFAYMGAIEETEDATVKSQFDINVFAMLRIIRSFLPHLRAQDVHATTGVRALIMNLSSIGGFRGYPSNGVYCATKFAVEAITEALSLEVSAFQIGCVSVEPGYFRTAFLKNPAAGANLAPPLDVYKGTPAHAAREAFSLYNGRQPGNPVEGAKRIWEYATGTGLFEGKKKFWRLPLGSDCGNEMKKVSEELRETAEAYEEVWKSTDFKE